MTLLYVERTPTGRPYNDLLQPPPLLHVRSILTFTAKIQKL